MQSVVVEERRKSWSVQIFVLVVPQQALHELDITTRLHRTATAAVHSQHSITDV